MTYFKEFMRLKCSKDILELVGSIPKVDKEISEAMAVIKRIKKPILAHPHKYSVVDLCSGNGLVPLLAAYTLPIKQAVAVDIRPRIGDWDRVRNFEYWTMDIFSPFMADCIKAKSPCIITSVHACGGLAVRVLDLFWEVEASGVVLVPCCIYRSVSGAVGTLKRSIPQVIKDKLGNYLAWAYALSQYGDCKLYVDKKILSPCRAIVIGGE